MKTLIHCLTMILFAAALAACSNDDHKSAGCPMPSGPAVAATNQVPAPAGSSPSAAPCSYQNLSMAIANMQPGTIPAVTAAQVNAATGANVTPAQLAALKSQAPSIIATSLDTSALQKKAQSIQSQLQAYNRQSVDPSPAPEASAESRSPASTGASDPVASEVNSAGGSESSGIANR